VHAGSRRNPATYSGGFGFSELLAGVLERLFGVQQCALIHNDYSHGPSFERPWRNCEHCPADVRGKSGAVFPHPEWSNFTREYCWNFGKHHRGAAVIVDYLIEFLGHCRLRTRRA
jgi:hypothetical protein